MVSQTSLRLPAVVALTGLVILACAGCNGGGSSGSLPPAPPANAGAMFITDFSTNSISGYGQGANCNCAPSVFIQGGSTGLSGPVGIAFDTAGNIYVTNENVNSMTKYSGAANGNVAPIFSIGGLNNPIGIAVASNGNVYIANSASAGVGAASIMVFPPGKTAPTQIISGPGTGLSTPGYLTLDVNGNIWVANQTSDTIEEFAKTASGNVPPIAAILGGNTLLSDPQGLAFDSFGRLYVGINNALGFSDAVLIFSPPLIGDISPSNILCGPNTAVNNPTGVAVNSQGTLFVVNSAIGGVPGYLTIFASNNIGGGTSCAGPLPNATVGGGNSSLLNPAGIALRG
jgi:hypothetical protein